MVQVKTFVNQGMNDRKERTLEHGYTGTIQGESTRFCYLDHTKLKNPSSSPLGEANVGLTHFLVLLYSTFLFLLDSLF